MTCKPHQEIPDLLVQHGLSCAAASNDGLNLLLPLSPSGWVLHCLCSTALNNTWVVFAWIKDIKLITKLCIFVILQINDKNGVWRYWLKIMGWLLDANEGPHRAFLGPYLSGSPTTFSWVELHLFCFLSSLRFFVLILWVGKLGCERLQIFTVRLIGLRRTMHKQPISQSELGSIISTRENNVYPTI